MTRDETLTAEEVEGKDKLKQEVEEWWNNTFKVFYLTHEQLDKMCTDLLEPREKQIQIDAEQILALQKQNGELTDKVNDLEDKLANADYQLEGRDNEIAELKAQIEEMKNCKNCANYMISGKCPCFFRTGWCKNWEMTRSKK